MKPAHEKYIPFVPLKMARRAWPDRELKAPPVWCSVDLRDGNQALIDPMNVREKLELFHTLVDIGVKEIEVGFPSASETEYEFIRTLIEGGHIPDDVTIQVLVQAREHLIRRTFEAIDGAKHVIFHFYNSTSTLQQKVVFHTDVEGVKKIAVDAARLIRELSQPALDAGMDLRYEYSPESFMGTEMDAAVEICQAVIEAIGATPERKVILNLPTTVENCMPNYFADYDTTVHFISQEELDRDHSGIPHGGFVIRTGTTGADTKQMIEYSLKLGSNPEFTSSVIVAYARAAYKMAQEGITGAKTVFDVAPTYLSPLSAEEQRKNLL